MEDERQTDWLLARTYTRFVRIACDIQFSFSRKSCIFAFTLTYDGFGIVKCSAALVFWQLWLAQPRISGLSCGRSKRRSRSILSVYRTPLHSPIKYSSYSRTRRPQQCCLSRCRTISNWFTLSDSACWYRQSFILDCSWSSSVAEIHENGSILQGFCC